MHARGLVIALTARCACALSACAASDVVDAEPPTEWIEVRRIEAEHGAIAIVATETLRAGPVVDRLEDVAYAGTRIESSGRELAVAFPMRVMRRGDDVLLADAFLRGVDGLVTRLQIVTDEATSASGGCLAVAREMITSLTATRVRIDQSARTIRFASLELDVPAGFAHAVERGPDFDVLRVVELTPEGRDHGWLGIYDGQFADFTAGDAPAVTRRIGGELVPFYDRLTDGVPLREGLIEGELFERHIFYGGDTVDGLARMDAIAETLRAATR